MKILIVKMSALGDIIQAIPLAKWLKNRFPESSIHWALEKKFYGVVERLSYLEKTVLIDRTMWRKTLRQLREEKYDYVFDIQGNIKSGFVTLCARSKKKIGRHRSQVREWPSTLATTDQIEVDASAPMVAQYVQIAQKFFCDNMVQNTKVILPITKEEEEDIEAMLQVAQGRPILMICPASAWENKRLSLCTWTAFIKKIGEKFDPYFLFIFGSQKEKEEAGQLHKLCPEDSSVIGGLPIAVWQNLMTKMQGVVCVDSSALHLAALGGVPTFSIFGPTQAAIFQPTGPLHTSFQGACPYGEKFPKQCKLLRECKTGLCLKGVTAEDLFDRFKTWFLNLA